MFENIVYTVLLMIGVGAACAIADHFGLFDDEEPVSQNEEGGN